LLKDRKQTRGFIHLIQIKKIIKYLSINKLGYIK